MNEQLFQYIWQFQHYNSEALSTIDGDAVQIIHPGARNHNQGPDFLNARVLISNTTWAGNIELHLKTSDWQKHRHNADANYGNVILHVVYKHDAGAGNIPVLELNTRISRQLLQRYAQLMNAQAFIACESMIATVPRITVLHWKDRLAAERLTRKSALILDYLAQNKNHWEESFWWLLAKNFGSTVNGDAFEAIAKSIPIHILAKHKLQLHQLEALLLGQAGLLQHRFSEHYPLMLQKEYKFLKAKYNLIAPLLPVQFLRMRPGNFPTVRLAQLAALIHQSAHLFSKIIEEPSSREAKKWLNAIANDYWHYHYTFDETSACKPKKIGAAMVDNIIINTVAPMLFIYGSVHTNQALKDKALQWLSETKAEKNAVTKGFETIGIENKNALDSQSLIELKTQYCNKKRCLQCAIGNSLLKKA